MYYGIPLFSDRIAPRCSIADTMLLVRSTGNEIVSVKRITMDDISSSHFLKYMLDSKIDTLICGGISANEREEIVASGINVVENVACNSNEILEAIRQKKVRSGLGFTTCSGNVEIVDFNYPVADTREIHSIDCLMCSSQDCKKGKGCSIISKNVPKLSQYEERIVDAATDIMMEEERKLCRLSEVIYFALEMNYKKIGIAYCTELTDQTEILARVLRRFFNIYPVCCKIHGKDDRTNGTTVNGCNPKAQADVLNRIGVDYNIMVGLCVGADSIFAKASKADVTTLFVKDKSLANNPIGALYSDYYLKEVSL